MVYFPLGVRFYQHSSDMSIEGSNQSSECLHNEPLSPEMETKKLPLKPGKAYGITSLICGLYSSLLPLLVMLAAFQIVDVVRYLPEVITLFLLWSALPSAVVGIIFGVVGICRERFFTLGWFFAIIGLILSFLSLLYLLIWLSFIYARRELGVRCC